MYTLSYKCDSVRGRGSETSVDSGQLNPGQHNTAHCTALAHTVRQMLFIKPIILRKDWSSSNFRVNRYTADFYTNKTEVSE